MIVVQESVTQLMWDIRCFSRKCIKHLKFESFYCVAGNLIRIFIKAQLQGLMRADRGKRRGSCRLMKQEYYDLLSLTFCKKCFILAQGMISLKEVKGFYM